MLRSMHRSARWRALALRLNDCSIRRILHKDLHHHPCKIQFAQEFSERDKASRLQSSNEFLGLVKNNSDIVNTLLMSDETHFHVSGYVNKQKCRYWTPNNGHELHQRHRYSAIVTVWCAVYCYGIIGPYFFDIGEGRTVSVYAERYKVMSEIFLRIDLHPRQQDLLRFQQDGATAHRAKFSMQVLRTMFPGRLFAWSGTSLGPPAT